MADQHRQNERFQVAPEIERRSFIQAGLASAGTILASSVLPSQIVSAAVPPQMTNSGADQIPRRPLGKTGEQVSIIGLGGYHLGTVQSSDLAVRLVHEAVDAGITFFDNAWEYNDHRSEEWMGLGLQGRRDKVFLMTKVCTHGRDKKVAMQQLEESLKRLGTDHLDLWQIHEVIYENDPELHFAKGGVVEALDEAKKQGKVRFVGFTGHKSPAIHLKMLAYNYPFDTVQMPLNCFDATYRSFEQQVLPELAAAGDCSARHEEPRRRRPADPVWRREGGRSASLCHEPAGRDHDLRYRLAGRAAPERGNCARLQTDVAARDAGAP